MCGQSAASASQEQGMELIGAIIGAILEGSLYSIDGGGDASDWVKGVLVVISFIAVMVGLVLLLMWLFG